MEHYQRNGERTSPIIRRERDPEWSNSYTDFAILLSFCFIVAWMMTA